MKTETSHLRALFDAVAAATERGDAAEALRLADSARRSAPDDPAAILLQARLALATGDAAAAADALSNRDDAESLLLLLEAACQAGRFDEAGAAARQLLARYAVDALPTLPALLETLCRADARLAGWVGIDASLRLVGIAAEGSLRLAQANVSDAPIAAGAAVGDGNFVSFVHPLLGRGAGVLRVRIGSAELLGSGLVWPPPFDLAGWVVIEHQELHGELVLPWNRRATVFVNLQRGDTVRRIAVPPPAADAATAPFSVRLAGIGSGGPYLEVWAELPDGSAMPLAGSPLRLPQPAPVPVAPDITPPRPARRAAATPPLTSIIVPVYRGVEETLACLRSILATVPAELATVTVIDDASPETPLRDALKLLAGTGAIRLLRNTCNLGFPGAANRGMRLHRDRDVVLLNADAEVFPGWLERLRAAAYSEERIGTVTPLGEAASVMSYGGGKGLGGNASAGPGAAGQGAADQAPASQAEAASIARIAAEVNAGRRIELPVGVGFCLYIRRACLDDVGDFDELGFGKGYGEENDFCLRARARGWRHMGAPDVFVRHVGGRSFGRARELLLTRNTRVLNYRHPGYDALVRAFLTADPLHEVKRAIDRQWLIESARRPVLLVSHAQRGGVRRCVDERRRALRAEGHTVLTLNAPTHGALAGRAVLSVAGADFAHLSYDPAHESGALTALLERLNLVAIEIHQFLGLPGPLLESLVALGVPYRVFVHDYIWICPRVNLLNGSGRYCGEPAVAECERCVARDGMAWEEALTVAELRERSARVLAGARSVLAPTHDVAERLARYFPDLAIEITPWEAVPAAPAAPRPGAPRPGAPRASLPHPSLPRADGVPARTRTRVALIGAIEAKKGWAVLLACAEDAAARDLPVEFVVIGYSSDDLPLIETGRVFLTGPYEESEAAALIAREECSLALFPTVGPETWCYALTHALAAGLPVVAFDLGAVAERLRALGSGTILPLTATPAAINDTLCQLAAVPVGVSSSSSESVRSTVEPMESRTAAAAPAASAVNETATPAANEVADTAAPDLAATVQVLTLPEGLYAFTVQSGGGRAARGLSLPALQVAPAPAISAGRLEFLSGPATLDRWLTGAGDVITVKVSGGDATLLLTSVRAPDSSVLAIDVRRLDAVPPPAEAPSPEVSRVAPKALASDEPRVLTLVHVPYLGDLTFVEGWAGRPTENLWIEGFSVLAEEPSEPTLLEYCGVTEHGETTPWMSAGEYCGTRGSGVPLVAFAVRVNPAVSSAYQCSYAGQFLSGTVIGPFDDGRLCRSEAPGDPLVAIELRLAADRMVAAPLAAESAHAVPS